MLNGYALAPTPHGRQNVDLQAAAHRPGRISNWQLSFHALYRSRPTLYLAKERGKNTYIRSLGPWWTSRDATAPMRSVQNCGVAQRPKTTSYMRVWNGFPVINIFAPTLRPRLADKLQGGMKDGVPAWIHLPVPMVSKGIKSFEDPSTRPAVTRCVHPKN